MPEATMQENFINKFTYKCLLGPQSKDIKEINNIAAWKVQKKNHFTNLNDLDTNDISYLKTQDSFNFHYLTENNMNFLKTNGFKVSKTKLNSCCIDLNNYNYTGKKFRDIRNAINKNTKHNFTIQDNFNDIKDVKEMLNEWSEVLAEKYFRDFSGKNYFFYSNNYHLNCLNTFVYENNKLLAFATLSPEINGSSSYIIGKALCNKYSGLSEYADDLAYQKAIKLGVKKINLGQSKGAIATYKNKFPNAYNVLHFDGTIEK